MNHSIRLPRIMANCIRATLVISFSATVMVAGGLAVSACPFCSAASRTLTEELELSDAAVLAKLAGPDAADPDTGDARFQVVKVLGGEAVLGDQREIETVFFGEPDPNQVFLITGIGTDYTQWATPLPLSAAGIDYLSRLSSVPDVGADRLAFFQEYLEHDDPLLAQDAYDEFARAPYAEVRDLSPRMHHDRLVAWITDPECNPRRRRLYLTMLGVCGSDADLPMLEEMITSGYNERRPFVEPLVYGGLAMGGPLELPTWTEFVKLDERRKKLGLDALIACYMVLRGPDGLDLIEKQLLIPKNVDYTHVFQALMALRFLGEETTIVPRERLLASARLLLDNPEIAEQVIPDLARWEDWSVMDRLVDMFKSSDARGYIRRPIVAYLLVAAEQPAPVGARASAALAELEQLDPEEVQRARGTMDFGFLARARSVDPAPGATRPEIAAVKSDEADAVETPPDPAEFDDRMDANAATTADEINETETIAVPATSVAAADVPAASPPVVNPASETLSPLATNTLLVVGLPVGAMVLLVGVFWLILRSGAA